MIKAAIDIGTNTVLLLIAEVNNGGIKVLHEEQRAPRLGKGVDAERAIHAEAASRVISVLNEYKMLLNTRYAEAKSIIVTATSAVRDARNRDAFIAQVKSETGFEIRLLSGQEEAEWTATGALASLDKAFRKDTYVLDIGGGSTETAHVVDGTLSACFSFDMGSVRFTEKFLKENPPARDELAACRGAIKKYYHTRKLLISSHSRCVGVAGTLTTLASILAGNTTYVADAINGVVLTLSDIQLFIKQYAARANEVNLAAHPELLKGREDVFLAGLLILEGFLLHTGLPQITVSSGGIRHGALLKI